MNTLPGTAFQEAINGRCGRRRRRSLRRGPSKIPTKFPAFTLRIRVCTVLYRKRSRSIISPLWPKPMCRFYMSAAASIRILGTIRLRLKSATKKLGGKIEVIVKKGEGHYPLALENPAPVVDFYHARCDLAE